MTPASLRNHTAKHLAQMAKHHGVPGWHSMRKEQLIRALLKAGQKRNGKKNSGTASGNGNSAQPRTADEAGGGAKSPPPSAARRKISELQAKLSQAKNLATETTGGSTRRRVRDRLVVMVRDPYWLHAYWELSRKTVARVQAAMGQAWHTAKPILRLYLVRESRSGTATDTWLRDIEVHGGVHNWYVDVEDPPKAYRLEIGYLSAGGEFHAMARSNVVRTPQPAARDTLDENWHDVAENFDKIYAMSGGYTAEGTSKELKELLEERLRRPMGAPLVTRYGAGAGAVLERTDDFDFEVDAELIVYGVSRPDAHVTLKGEPVPLRRDGTFTVRLNLPDRRQVIPVVAASRDGGEQRTIVLAIDRNTKRMETIVRDPNQI